MGLLRSAAGHGGAECSMTVLDQIKRADVEVPVHALETVVRRIVAVADPERIILFGSSARGEMRSHSDLDLLVIKGGAYDYHRLISDIYGALAGIDVPVEVVLVTPEQAERYRNSFCLVIHPALRQGKLIYEQAALRA